MKFWRIVEAWESPATRANRGVPLKYAALALAVVAGLGSAWPPERARRRVRRLRQGW